MKKDPVVGRQQLSSSFCTQEPPLAEHVRTALNLNPLPESGYVRLSQLIGDPGDLNATPPRYPVPPIVPVGKSSIWAWVKAGRFPAPVKIGPRTTAWDVRLIRQFLDKQGA